MASSLLLSYSGLKAPDAKMAKNAIAKAAKCLRILLENDEEKQKVLFQHGLLRDKDAESLSKELQKNIMQDPAMFWVLLREIVKFPDGIEAARKLEGNLYWRKVLIMLRCYRPHICLFS